MRFKFQLGVVLAFFLLLTVSCNDYPGFQPDFRGLTQFKVLLTDNPTDLEGVFIHIKKVVVIGRGERQEIDLETDDQFINLLDYQNGETIEISGGIIDLDFVKEIRLVLYDDNYVVVDGKEYPLKVPSGLTSGLKIKTCIDLSETMNYELVLDFDAERSVKRTGASRYMLKPVIHVMNDDGRCAGYDDDDGDDDDNGEHPDCELSFHDLPEWLQEKLSGNYMDFCFVLGTDQVCGSEEEFHRLDVIQEGELLEVLYYNSDQEFYQAVYQVALEDLPDAVVETLTNDYPQYNIAEGPAEEIVDADNNISYGVRLIHQGNDQVLKVYLAEDGTVLCEEEE